MRVGPHQLRGSLHVDVHNDVLSLEEHPLDLASQRPIPLAMHLGALRELTALSPRSEFLGREKKVVAPSHFSRTRLSCRARDRVSHVGTPLQQPARYGGLSAP
jgi:hypothetical protein